MTTIRERPPLGSTFSADALADLPASGNLLSLLDTAMPDVIADRVDTGGLSTGEAARVGGHGSSWTQTTYRLGEVDITDPDGGGTPLLLPGVLEWDRVDVSTGVMPTEINAPGLAVSLTPRRPGKTWTRRGELFGARSGLVADTTEGTPPAIARLNSYGSGSLLLGGPLRPDRLGIVFAGAWAKASRYERAGPTLLDSDLGSLFGHLVYTPTPRDEVRLIGWGQRASYPFTNRIAFGQPSAGETDTSAHGQVAWQRRTRSDSLWTAFAGVTGRQRSLKVQPASSILLERLRDGPPASLLYPGTGTDLAWSIGVRVRRSPIAKGTARHALRGGVEVGAGAARVRPAFGGLIGEIVNGMPARVWDYSTPSADSRWSSRTIAAYASDQMQVTPRLTIEGGLRLEAISGSAETTTDSVSWRDLLPRAGLRFELFDWAHIATFVNYTRTAHRLPLSDLAWGDRSAPTGSVYRWNTTSPSHAPLPNEIGTLVQRVGPGIGDDTSFTSIDPRLKRPHMDEIVLGFEGRPLPSTVIRLSAMARRERQLVGVVDTGVPASSYSVQTVPDDNIKTSPDDDQQIPLYSRNPATFGLDRYVLTNPADDEATLVGVDVSGQASTDRLFLLAGATASRSEGLAGSIGFLPIENDASVLGDVYINPNSRRRAQGRLFTERGYTIKLAGAYCFAHDFRTGIVARYQDGQHFARLVIAPDVSQGPELVRAFRNGRTRFTYTMTVDARVQKGFTLGLYHLTAIVDAYNLFNQSSEMDEYVITGLGWRDSISIQPPRTVHIGVRVRF